MKKENIQEISNDENIANLKKRKYLRYAIIFFALITIVFALLDLIMQNTLLLLLAIIFFIITTFLNKYRESLKIIKHDDLKEVREAIEENKKKFQRGEPIPKEVESDKIFEEIEGTKGEKKAVPKKKNTPKNKTNNKKGSSKK